MPNIRGYNRHSEFGVYKKKPRVEEDIIFGPVGAIN